MKRALIVDDDLQFLEVLEVLLQRHGYTIQTAYDGLEALDFLNQLKEQAPPDIVVADVTMPRCDGLELCRQVRQIREFELLPFIFLSARTLTQDRVAGLRVGADDYLTKPFEPEELIVRIENSLERVRRMHSEMVRSANSQPQTTVHFLAKSGKLLRGSLVEASPIAELTATEQEVFGWVARGLTNREVADQMYLSVRTVEGHVANIRAKLNLPRRSAIVQFAHQHRLV